MKKSSMKKFPGFAAALAVMATLTLAGCPPETPALHTQVFPAGENNLEGNQLYFMPTPSVDFYQRVVTPGVTGVTNGTDDATVADVMDGAEEVFLGPGNAISFYGNLYDTIYVGADGTIGFGAPGDNTSLISHFSVPEVSLLPVDLSNTSGTISYEVVGGDQVAVTYEGVMAGGAPATAQAQFYIVDSVDGGSTPDFGDIVLSYPSIGPDAAGVIGLSNGQLMGANQAQAAAFLESFATQRGAALTSDVMTGTIPAET